MPRIKAPNIPTISSRDEAEFVVGEITRITLNKIRFTTRMDAEIAAVRKKYEANLAQCDTELKEKTSALAAWADLNRPELFPKKRKSMEFVQGTIGYRTGNPTVVLASRAWSWDKVLQALQALRWRKFIRVKREVDKEAFLARAASVKATDKFAANVLARVGLKINQSETFFVEPSLTEVETRQAKEAA
jgi:phage host-nuclease inhibitor protein Gam